VLTPALMLDIAWIHYLSAILAGAPLAWVYFHWIGDGDVPELNHWLKLCLLVGVGSLFTMSFVL